MNKGMLPAGFEPTSGARKAPILDRTRLREQRVSEGPRPIIMFWGRPGTSQPFLLPDDNVAFAGRPDFDPRTIAAISSFMIERYDSHFSG